jgi:hypothetical protein
MRPGNKVGDSFRLSRDKMHVIQDVRMSPPSRGGTVTGMLGTIGQQPVRYIRLLIKRPATRYGASIWRLQVYGIPYEEII